jgi:predicted RNA-binding Zn-ribbon protein involved in translation (DUF1610 family)
MAQQVSESKQRKPTGLLQCNYCNHVWLARSTTPVLTCSACGNHIIVRDNTVTTDIFGSQNQKEAGGPADQSSPPSAQTQSDTQPTTPGFEGGMKV